MKAFIIAIFFIVFSAAVQAEDLNLFVFAGQTIMAGTGKAEDLPSDFQGPEKDVLYAARSSKKNQEPIVTGSAENPWTELQPLNGSFGPEIAFGRTISEKLPHTPVAIVKIAAAGRSLAENWNPEATREPRLYSEMLEFVRSAIERREKEGDTVKVAGFIWYQGEADAHNEKAAAAYKENLSRFFFRLRTDLKTPELPIVAVRIGIRQRNAGRFEPEVRAAIESVCGAGPRTAWVDVDGLSLLDGKYLDSMSELEAGKRLATAWLRLKAEK